MNRDTKILLADDHVLFMDALEMMINLEPTFNVVGKVQDGEHVVDFVSKHEVDVIVLDINMPNMDGLDALEKLKKNKFEGGIIMLSSISDTRMVHDALKKGALGYLSKKCARKEIVGAIKAVIEDESYFGEEINRNVLNELIPGKKKAKQVEASYSLKQLTERELEVLRLIALEYTSKEIAEELFIAQSTVDTHRKKLIEKLQVKNAVGLGKIALQNGLI